MKKKSDILGGGGSAGTFEIELYNEQVEIKVKVALLEQSIGHINQTLIRIEKTMENGFASLEEKIQRVDSKVDSRFLWLLSFFIAGFTGLTGVMAHGFHWI